MKLPSGFFLWDAGMQRAWMRDKLRGGRWRLNRGAPGYYDVTRSGILCGRLVRQKDGSWQAYLAPAPLDMGAKLGKAGRYPTRREALAEVKNTLAMEVK